MSLLQRAVPWNRLTEEFSHHVRQGWVNPWTFARTLEKLFCFAESNIINKMLCLNGHKTNVFWDTLCFCSPNWFMLPKYCNVISVSKAIYFRASFSWLHVPIILPKISSRVFHACVKLVEYIFLLFQHFSRFRINISRGGITEKLTMASVYGQK